MLKTLISYQLYIIIGILVFPIFAFIIYFTKKLIDRARFVKALHNMKKPLMERINSIDTIYEMKEKKEEMNMIIHQIKNDIDTLKQEIYVSQDGFQLEKIDQIEKDIHMFYEKMQGQQTPEQVQTPTNTQQSNSTIQQAQQTQQIYQNTVQPVVRMETPRVTNESFSKFLVVYREKDKVIDDKNRLINEKNKSIYVLQQKLTEAELKLKQYITQEKNNQNKDKIIEEKIQFIQTLQQRLQDVENKFQKIALLHKSITEKEQIKDQIIEEKNQFIMGLQSKLSEIENKLQSMATINEDNKEKFLNRKLSDIDQKIQAEKRKTRIFIVLLMLFLLV